MLRAITLLALPAALIITAVGSLTPRAAAQADEAKKAALQELLIKAEDEYRLFFHKPKTPFEYWAAIDFEMKTGKFDVAGLLLDQLVKMPPKDKVDQKLLEIEEIKGMSAFLHLATVKKWHKNPDLEKEARQNVKELIDRVTKALEKHLSDPVRINQLIEMLDAKTFPERAFAFKQLKRTKERAVPYLVAGLIKNVADKKKQQRILSTMLILDPEIMPPLVEILKPADAADYNDPDLRPAILELFRLRNDTTVVPYLWHMMASPKFPLNVRLKAKQTLAYLLEMHEDKLPDAKYALTQLAEKYYHHQEKFRHVLYDAKTDAQYVKFWAWNKGQTLDKMQLKSVSDLEVFFAMRHAKEALDLDPTYKPAQKLMLTMILDQTFGKSLDQFLLKPLPEDLTKLLATIDSNLLLDVLHQAMNEHNLPVILPLVQILGERGEIKAALPSLGGSAQGIVKALYYPDRRVQLAGIRAMLSLPADHPPPVRSRIVELLAQFLLTEPVSKALVIHTPEGQEMHMRDALKKAGFEAVLVPDRKQALTKLHETADYDHILIHGSYPEDELPYLLGDLRADADAGLLPVHLLTTPKNLPSLKSSTAKYRNVFLLLDGLTATPPVLKKEMDDAYKLCQVPTFLKDVPEANKDRVLGDILAAKGLELSMEERKMLSYEAMEVLWRMGHGTIKGYSLQPAKKALIAAIQKKELAEKAIDALGSLSGADVQQRLAVLTVDTTLDKKVRTMAAFKLHHHILNNGLVLSKLQIDNLRQATDAATDPELRKQLLVLVSRFPATSAKTGIKLGDFTPKPVK